MIATPKVVTLKNGLTVTFRTPDLSDAQALLDYMKTVSGESDYLGRYPEEWASVTLESEESWVRSRRESDDNFVLACFMDDLPIGLCEVMFHRDIKVAHRGNIAISIRRDYWGLGIGSILFTELLRAAHDHHAEILDLEMFEENKRALHLYEKFGFKVVAVRPRSFRLKDGSYHNELMMQKILNDEA